MKKWFQSILKNPPRKNYLNKFIIKVKLGRSFPSELLRICIMYIICMCKGGTDETNSSTGFIACTKQYEVMFFFYFRVNTIGRYYSICYVYFFTINIILDSATLLYPIMVIIIYCLIILSSTRNRLIIWVFIRRETICPRMIRFGIISMLPVLSLLSFVYT